MAIRIARNAAGNCINFIGSSMPAYYNACLSGSVDSNDSTLVNVINDIHTANNPNGEVRYEFYQIPFTEFTDANGAAFADAQAAADYITQEGNVLGVSDTGTDLNGITVNFRLDQTSTSIIMDNGAAFGVNTIKAVPASDGTIHINAIGAGVPSDSSEPDTHEHFQGLQHTNVQINGVAVSGGINDVCNALNELFTVGAFESVVISDPHSTLVADVSGDVTSTTLHGTYGVDPIGDDVYGSSSNGSLNGFKTVETIDQAGEYFTFDIRNESQIGFGLVISDAAYAAGSYPAGSNTTYLNPSTFGTGNSAHYGFQFSHWFHPTPNGSWTNYGALTGYIQGAAWSNSNVHFEGRDEWLAGDPVKIKVGIDENGFIAISSLADDGVTWKLHARTNYPVPQGFEAHLGIKTGDTVGRVYTQPKVHLLEPAAPVMNFRYIESPDGNFEYPLFATAEEANYYDLNHSGVVGTGTSHTHTYADDPTGTTWYMPDTGNTMTATSAPTTDLFMGNAATYTEITSYTNADLTPPAFSNADITQQEGSAVNIPIQPMDVGYTSSVSISPSGSGMVYNSGSGVLQGTLSDVASDTDYTVTVTRVNSYGSSVGSFTVTVTDLAPATTHTTPWTKALDFSGSSERTQQANNSNLYTPLKMGGNNNQVSAPSVSGNTVAAGYPWATAVVFSTDKHASNQHIWNMGEGAGSTDDNIYLRTDATGKLYFGWGRDGDRSEMLIHPHNTGTGWTMTAGAWYGIYIGYNGTVYGANNTTSLFADAFDIRLTGSTGSFGTVNLTDTNLSNAADTTITGDGRMNRSYDGYMTIGRRGANRSFHGKVASMVVTTLRCNVAMPDTAEINEMITDPLDWLTNYKVGNAYRRPSVTTDSNGFTMNTYDSANSTQVWLMGDGTSDSYANMIRNAVYVVDQNRYKMNMISMVSNDIQNVSITGLT